LLVLVYLLSKNNNDGNDVRSEATKSAVDGRDTLKLFQKTKKEMAPFSKTDVSLSSFTWHDRENFGLADRRLDSIGNVHIYNPQT
jgi:hypothetical protein